MRRRVVQGMGTSMSMGIGPNGEMQSEIPLVRMDRMVPGDAGKGFFRPDGTIGESFVKKTPTKNGTPASGGKGKAAAKPRGGRGTKRKRAKEESEESAEESDIMSKLGGDSESDAGSIMELPKITQSGRQVVKPAQFVPAVSETHARKRGPTKRTQEQALCKRCGRGHSPQSNMIVFCDGCNLGWHQMCHDPTISDEAVKDETAPWYCADCSRKRGRKTTTATVEEPRGVSWQGRSESEVYKLNPSGHFITNDPSETRILLLSSTSKPRLSPYASRHSTTQPSHLSTCISPSSSLHPTKSSITLQTTHKYPWPTTLSSLRNSRPLHPCRIQP